MGDLPDIDDLNAIIDEVARDMVDEGLISSLSSLLATMGIQSAIDTVESVEGVEVVEDNEYHNIVNVNTRPIPVVETRPRPISVPDIYLEVNAESMSKPRKPRARG